MVLPPAASTQPGSTGITATPSLRRRTGDIVRSGVRRPGAPGAPGARPAPGAPGRPGARPSAAQGAAAPVVTGNTDIGSTSAGASSAVTLQNTGEGGGLPGEREFNQCKKLPPGRRILKFNFKPDSEISDLVGWISTISCTQFLIAGPTLQGKKVTVLSPQLITPEEAYRLFLGALESVGLTVEPMGKFLRIVETGRARFSNLPVIKDGEPMYGDKRYVTRLFRFDHLESTDVLTNLYNQVRGEQGVGVAYQGVADRHRPGGDDRSLRGAGARAGRALGQQGEDLDGPGEEHLGQRDGRPAGGDLRRPADGHRRAPAARGRPARRPGRHRRPVRPGPW